MMTEDELRHYAELNRDTIMRAAKARGVETSDPRAMELLLNDLLSENGYTLVDGVWRLAQH